MSIMKIWLQYSYNRCVAREMKKPCVIGTKNRTRVLKDGDRVEVDAEKGIARIIKCEPGASAGFYDVGLSSPE